MQPDLRTSRRPALAFAVVCLGTVAAPLDSAVNIAFPSITSAFAMPVESIRWVIISYVLTYASLMLVFGKLGDLFGYRRIFQSGLLIASAGFVACAFAPSLAWLLSGRVLQGVGIALVWSCAPALATSLYPEEMRTRVLALYGAVVAVGAALGPLAGGMLVEQFGWPVVFWARAPLVLVALLLSGSIPASVAPRQGAIRFDWLGAVLLVTWLTAFLMAAARPALPSAHLVTSGLLAAGSIAFLAFLAHERRHPEPIIRPALFQNGSFLVLNLASILVNLAGFAIMLLVPFHLTRTLALPPGVGGLVLAMNAIGIIAGSWIAGRLAPRFGQGRLAIFGAAISAAGLAMAAHTSAQIPLALTGSVFLVQGLGLGLFQIAYADAVLAHLPKADRGVAGSLTMVTRTIGIIGAATGLTALRAWFEQRFTAAGQSPEEAFRLAFENTLMMVSSLLVAGIVLALLRHLVTAARRPPNPARDKS